MTDKQIFECIDKKNSLIVESVEKMVSEYTKTLTLLITTENQNIKHSIDELTKKVKEQNGSVKTLNEWKAEMQGREKEDVKIEGRNHNKTIRILQLIGVVITIGLLYVGYRSLMRGQQEVKDDITNITPIIKRGSIIIPAEKPVYVIDTARVDSIINLLVKQYGK
jgi:hypothetical protein